MRKTEKGRELSLQKNHREKLMNIEHRILNVELRSVIVVFHFHIHHSVLIIRYSLFHKEKHSDLRSRDAL